MSGAMTKEKILNAANELFATHGYDDVSMRDIAAKVGITEGAIYRHYEGKAAILTEIIAVLRKKYAEILYPIDKARMDKYLETETPRQILERCKLTFEIADFHFLACAISIALQEHITNPDAKELMIHQVYHQLAERIEYVLVQLMERGSIPRFNASAYSKVWARFSISTLSLWVSLVHDGIPPDKAEVNYPDTLDWLIELALTGKAQ